MNDRPAEARSVVIERELPFPPETLWRALTRPHLIEAWLMQKDFEPTVGHRFTLRNTPRPDVNVVLDCQVLTVEPSKTLSYSWNHAHADPAFNLQSVVTFTLTPTPTGTRLRAEQMGFPAGSETGVWRR